MAKGKQYVLVTSARSSMLHIAFDGERRTACGIRLARNFTPHLSRKEPPKPRCTRCYR